MLPVEEILMYYDKTRQVGHTTAAKTGANNPIYVTLRGGGDGTIPLHALKDKLRGQTRPLVLDHEVVCLLLRELSKQRLHNVV